MDVDRYIYLNYKLTSLQINMDFKVNDHTCLLWKKKFCQIKRFAIMVTIEITKFVTLWLPVSKFSKVNDLYIKIVLVWKSIYKEVPTNDKSFDHSNQNK